jgi:hypothetical protein
VNGELSYQDIERAAVGYILEDEIWPVFVAWAMEHADTAAAVAWADSDPGPGVFRREWARHSPVPEIRAAADLYDDDVSGEN